MKDKHIHLCSQCIDLFSDSYNVRQIHAKKQDHGKCDNCKHTRYLYTCIVSSKENEKRDDSYAG